MEKYRSVHVALRLNATNVKRLEPHIVTTSPLKVFIDTEFTDLINTGLISLGMVAESGAEFYAEVPYRDAECSDFVRMAVIPLLGKIPNAACSFGELRGRMLSWLRQARPDDREVEICFDYQTDWDLFVDALDYETPEWCRPRLILAHLDQTRQYEFLRDRGLPKHHALYDALANRYAFREAKDLAG